MRFLEQKSVLGLCQKYFSLKTKNCPTHAAFCLACSLGESAFGAIFSNQNQIEKALHGYPLEYRKIEQGTGPN
ncbi:MAG: hypothetical protein IPM82_10200 [Saprospiraceae bacterium]|nr:hypothetical protein [Saprospiraceae bacterium]